jgi:predicted Fe-S protein YdhL (DUF1289 family)
VAETAHALPVITSMTTNPSLTPSTQVETHDHDWCYLGELLVNEVSRHRLEFCTGCGTARVKFDKWWYMYPELARELLEKCEKVRDRYVGDPPDNLSRSLRAPKKRLGRGLLDIQRAQSALGPTIQSLFPKPKGK